MSESKPASILYMEDDAGLARLVQKKLERAGYEVDIACDGEQGLGMCTAGSYDVIAVDQGMPVHDGLEVIRILASHGPLPSTIMVTGTGDEKIAVEAMKLGARDYIVKDVEGTFIELLPSVIEQVLHQDRITQEKQRAEEALRKAHSELEERVKERTAKLARTTEQLKIELTERKQAEEALRLAHRELSTKARDLEVANYELSQYDQVVAHLLKEPLRAIRNYSDFLREELEATLKGNQKSYLDSLNRAVQQGAELVDDLLEFSVVGRTSGPSETIDIGVFLQRVIASLNLSPDVEVVMGYDWPTIDTEPTLLRQIFVHLIRNAIKFNHSPLKRVELGWLPAGNERYELFVRDNGIGIEPRYQEQIFRMFERLHAHNEYDGTGIGLAICKKIVERHGGRIWVESKPDEGSTFYFTIPDAG